MVESFVRWCLLDAICSAFSGNHFRCLPYLNLHHIRIPYPYNGTPCSTPSNLRGRKPDSMLLHISFGTNLDASCRPQNDGQPASEFGVLVLVQRLS